MNVEFISTIQEKLHTIPIIDGQLIAVSDRDEYYYDVGGVRRTTSGQKRVTELPERGQENVIYILDDPDNPLKAGIFLWDSDKKDFYCLSSQSINTEVTTTPTTTDEKVYFTGTSKSEKVTGELVKILDIFANAKNGTLTAKGFLGNATSATKAVKDGEEQTIAATYIKNITVSGTTLTITRGDDKSFTLNTQDTHWTTKLVVGSSNAAGSNAAATNGNVYLNLFDNNTLRNSHNIKGTGSVTVTSDKDGNITVHGVNTTYNETTDTESGLFTPTERAKLAKVSEDADAVSYAQTITGGIKIGAITINGKTTDIYYDTKVKQNATTSNANYPLLLAPSGQSATSNAEAYFDSGVTLNPNTHTIAANISGNSGTASQLKTGRKIKLSGAITGEVTFTGAADVEIATSVNHTHSYAGAASSGGSATSAVKLDTSAGDVLQPIYFKDGKPVITTYALDMLKGATSSANGAYGLVPAPTKGQQAYYFKGNGVWAKPAASEISTVYHMLVNGTAPTGGSYTVESELTKIADVVKTINTSFVKGLSATGTSITYTKGDGTTGTLLNINDMTTKSYIAYDSKVITGNTLACWNGAYASNNASNLTYCVKGAFGDAAIKAVTTSVANGSDSLVTSGGVYSYINSLPVIRSGTAAPNNSVGKDGDIYIQIVG